MFEAEPLHIEAARNLRAFADRIEAAGECLAYVVCIDFPTEADIVASDVSFGGELARVVGAADWVKSSAEGATPIDDTTDFDALDAAAV